jgi:two-component system response regulator YesN
MAYKILIAEDEQIERSALKFIISNYVSKFEIAAEAANGVELLEFAKEYKPDVFVIDIKMPAIDGISAMRQIKEFLTDAEFIIVSAHTDFEYARQTIQLGASDYLIKPVKNERLISALYAVYNKIEERELKRKQNNLLDERIKLFKPQVEKNVLQAIASMHIDSSIVYQFEQYWDLPENKFFSIIAYEEINRYIEFKKRDKIIECYRKTLGMVCADFLMGFINDYLLILVPCTKNDQPEFRRKTAEYVKNCYAEVQFGSRLWVGKVTGSLKKITEEYREFRKTTASWEKADDIKTSELYGLILHLCEKISLGEIKQVITGLDKIFFYLQAETENAAEIKLRYCNDIYIILKSHIYSDKAAYASLSDYFESLNSCLETEKDLSRVFNEIREAVMCCVKYYNDLMSDTCSKITEMIDYITKNYTADVSLESLASKYNMSPSAASRAFKHKFQKNFIDYVTELRIEKAKKLLTTTDKSIKEITYEIGYNSQTYFCKVFKKETGISATEYKKNV